MRVLFGAFGLLRCSAHLQTCREPQRRSSGPFNPPPHQTSSISFPSPSVLFPQPGLTSPRRHARASSSAPNYIPAKAFYKGDSKRLWNGEEQSGTLRKHLGDEPCQQSVWPRCWSACDHLMRPGVEGAGTLREAFSGCEMCLSRENKVQRHLKGRKYEALCSSQWTHVRGCPLFKPHVCWAKYIGWHKIQREWKDEARTLSLLLLFVVQRLFLFIFF